MQAIHQICCLVRWRRWIVVRLYCWRMSSLTVFNHSNRLWFDRIVYPRCICDRCPQLVVWSSSTPPICLWCICDRYPQLSGALSAHRLMSLLHLWQVSIIAQLCAPPGPSVPFVNFFFALLQEETWSKFCRVVLLRVCKHMYVLAAQLKEVNTTDLCKTW